MEGNGPGSGDPVAMNLILMSTDPVALDSVFARLVYLKPEMVPTNYHGEKMGLGNCREENIEVVTVESEYWGAKLAPMKMTQKDVEDWVKMKEK